MKKILIVTALTFTTGIWASQTKVNSIHTDAVSMQKLIVSSEKKDLANGD